jgi:hypothetical protein
LQNSFTSFISELKATEIFHIDHLHPQTMFTKKNIAKLENLTDKQKAFYINANHWNSILIYTY